MILEVGRRHFLAIASLLFAAALSVPLASAQTDRATLEGTITDNSGATISGATIRIVAVATDIGTERTSGSNGVYHFPAIAVGEYRVYVTNPGFKGKEFNRVVVQVGETHTLDVTLDVGQATETVHVVADALPAERSTAEASTVIRNDQIANLPVNGRDWSALTLLAPFAQDDGEKCAFSDWSTSSIDCGLTASTMQSGAAVTSPSETTTLAPASLAACACNASFSSTVT